MHIILCVAIVLPSYKTFFSYSSVFIRGVTEVDWEHKALLVYAINKMSVYCTFVVFWNFVMLIAMTGAWGPLVGFLSLMLNAICGIFFAKFWRPSVLRHYKMYPLVDQATKIAEKKAKEFLRDIKVADLEIM